jgi:hypothetical protein
MIVHLRIFGVMAQSIEEAWASLQTEQVSGHGYDTAVHAIARAASATALRNFYPLTSMNRLCLARTAFPFEDVQEAFVSVSLDGRYRVYRGSPYRDSPVEVAETSDPALASAELVRMVPE